MNIETIKKCMGSLWVGIGIFVGAWFFEYLVYGQSFALSLLSYVLLIAASVVLIFYFVSFLKARFGQRSWKIILFLGVVSAFMPDILSTTLHFLMSSYDAVAYAAYWDRKIAEKGLLITAILGSFLSLGYVLCGVFFSFREKATLGEKAIALAVSCAPIILLLYYAFSHDKWGMMWAPPLALFLLAISSSVLLVSIFLDKVLKLKSNLRMTYLVLLSVFVPFAIVVLLSDKNPVIWSQLLARSGAVSLWAVWCVFSQWGVVKIFSGKKE